MSLEDDSSSLNLIKELRRNRAEQLRHHQDFNRSAAFEKHRFLANEIVNEQDIHGLCSRIKRRKRADESDLRRLANSFIQSEENIICFLKVTGAINVIVKEFTSNDRDQQLLAAQCLCNLSLGNDISCTKVSVFAGSYLMLFLVNINDKIFTRLCLWISQNIVVTGGKGLDILLSQELLANCIYVIENSLELQEDAIQLLELVIDSKLNEISTSDKKIIQQTIFRCLRKNHHKLSCLQVFLKTFDSSNFDEMESNEIVKIMVMNLIEVYDQEVIQCSLRIIELINQESLNTSFDFLIQNHQKLSNIINKTAESPKYFPLIRILLKFLIKAPNYYFLYDPIDNLKIPKFFEF